MSTVSVIFNERKITKKGEIPIWLRIIKDRKPKYIALGIKILKSQWVIDKNRVRKSHPNSQYLNNFIAQKVAEAEAVALEMEAANKYTSPVKIKNTIMGTSDVSYFKYARKSIEKQLRMGKMSAHHNELISLSKLQKYTQTTDLLFFDITVGFLVGYEEYLIREKKNTINTVYSNLKVIRKHFNDALREELIPFEKNPFFRYKLKRIQVDKNYLNESELETLENAVLDPSKKIYHSRNLFVFACYTGGIRFSDLITLKWANFDGENLSLITRKTGTKLNIKVPNIALEILNLYKKDDSLPTDFIFPYLKKDVDYSDLMVLYKDIQICNGNINKDLVLLKEKCKLKKIIHFHSSRHTWATLALKKGMRIEYVSKLMTHSSIKTTQIYAKIVNEELEKAMDVFNIKPPVAEDKISA